MKEQTYYLVFTVDRIPDLTLTKYSVLDGSSVDDIMDKHGVFLRQLHRLGSTSGVYFHLLYYFDPDERVPKGHHLSVVFYATSRDRRKLEGIREFLTTSVLSTYYDFHCYEVSSDFYPDTLQTSDKRTENVIMLANIAGQKKTYGIHASNVADVSSYMAEVSMGLRQTITCEIASDGDAVLSFNSLKENKNGQILFSRKHVLAKRMQIVDGKLRLFENDKSDSICEDFEYELSEIWEQVFLEERCADDGTRFICYFEPDGTKIIEIGSKMVPMYFSERHIVARHIEFGTNENGVSTLFVIHDDGAKPDEYPYDLTDEQINRFINDYNSGSNRVAVCYFNTSGNTIVELGCHDEIHGDANTFLTNAPEIERKFNFAAFLTKKDYYLPAQNRLDIDPAGEVPLYSIMEWEPCEDGRLYNVLKLMEGYNSTVALRIDIFPVEQTQYIRQKILPYADTRKRISERQQGKDDNSENIIKSWDKYLQNMMKFPQFFANVVAFSDKEDIAVMLADSVAAEAVESGTYIIEKIYKENGMSVYYSDQRALNLVRLAENDDLRLRSDSPLYYKEPGNYIAQLLTLYTLEELRPMFSLPILYPGESIECLKETDPKPFKEKDGESISIGTSSLGYNVDFPIKLFKKHAFIAGVPGAGKTNTMLHLVTSLWRDTEEKIPFLVLEPAKQEYRALAKIKGMEELRVFSPGADTYFPLHINPFQFPVGLTLAEHIANLNAVFAGAFELPPPSPHFIDTCIEKVYLDKGWNVNERNTLDENGKYRHEFPTLQELYASLEVAVKNSHYQGETLGNLQSVLEVRVGSLLKREIGNVYNVRESILKPEKWLDVPAIIELESLGEGPANFMSLLLSTLIRETLKVRKTSDNEGDFDKPSKDLNHVIFYEEAHNLIGPDTDSPMGDSVDPKISATKYVVKMLAEVRALGEGIVIADQLPTVMAPEVLKNTGLKIAHRITAQDDRALLGSTMFASPEQLEEQGTFGTGWALIFYEDLLKPYKMRVHEWDIHNKDKHKYDSPTNKQLFSYLKDNQTYRSTLLTSAKIMKEKMDVEYDQLRRRGEKLKESIDKEYLVIRALSRGIENQEATSLEMKIPEDVECNKIELQKQKQVVEERKSRFLQKHSRELHQLCWDYINQYYATITLANNYDFTSERLYASSVSGFFTIFETMRSLVDVPELTETLVSELKNVVSDTERFISLDKTKECVLKGSEIYPDLQYASGYYWVNDTYLKKKNLVAKAKRILQLDSDREKYINSYCVDWTNEFVEVYQKADAYAEATERLILIRESKAKALYVDEPEAYEQKMKQINDYKNKKYALYKMLHSMVVGPIKEAFRFLNGADRIAFLKASKKIRELHLEIVNYLDAYADTKLSGCDRYKKLREEATVIINMDLLARIELARSDRLLQTEQLISANSTEEKKKIIRLIRDTHNAYFEAYSRYNVERYDYQIILVNFYMQYLDSMMDFGDMAIQEMVSDDPSRYEVKKCSEIIQKLISNDTIPENQKISWNRIQNRWIKFFKET